MATVAEPNVANAVSIDPALFTAASSGFEGAVTMCGLTARCVGVSTVPSHEPGIVTGLIGVHGNASGFVTVNMSETFAIRAVEGLMQESFDKLNAQVVDGAGELTNIVVGGIKSSLASGKWSFSQITVPSVLIGKGYSIAYAQGLEYVCVTFEHIDKESVRLEDRLVNISISLLKL